MNVNAIVWLRQYFCADFIESILSYPRAVLRRFKLRGIKLLMNHHAGIRASVQAYLRVLYAPIHVLSNNTLYSFI